MRVAPELKSVAGLARVQAEQSKLLDEYLK